MIKCKELTTNVTVDFLEEESNQQEYNTNFVIKLNEKEVALAYVGNQPCMTLFPTLPDNEHSLLLYGFIRYLFLNGDWSFEENTKSESALLLNLINIIESKLVV